MNLDIRAAAEKWKGLSVGVIGDLCVDAYYFLSGEPAEISLETGKPVYSTEQYYFNLGGAANVAVNLKRLGAAGVELFGLAGDDPFAQVLDRLLQEEGITKRLIIQKDRWATHVYNKVYKSGQEEPRFDMGNFNVPAETSLDALAAAIETSLPRLDAVIINEQTLRGVHSPYFQKKLILLINAHTEKLWLCDSRNLNDVYKSAVHKLNEREASALYNTYHPIEPVSTLFDASLLKTVAAWLHGHWKKPVVITRGAAGAAAFDGGGFYEVAGLHIINRIDTVGAGDAFLAAMTLGLGAGLSLDRALELGNFSAGVSVQKLFQTGHPSLEEVLAISEAPDYLHNQYLADNPRQARYVEATEIEIIAGVDSQTPGIVVFDHDGTISTLRQGWEKTMEEVMLHCILGDSYAKVSENHYLKTLEEVRDFIGRTTGVQTLIQMEGLEKMVRSFGYVAEEKILDPVGYKKIYNAQLMKMIEKKMLRVQEGKLSAEDCTIKGAVPFLKRLHKAGVALYLASGTDEEDVRREAAFLGYENLFARIYGSRGNIAEDPKRAVFKKIMAGIGELPPQQRRCAVFGDGPVELREARRNGAAAIGLTSNEEQRFGVNPVKRHRLILAGADLLIPDFSWVDELVSYLEWNL
ncbi:MAG: PfkB family carbohydrate kinase [Treponema sp.]|jgi:rfaE bifunctional protein kinase chain/domain|nr:PfkB family carbohydrate kinase [Treponema sp.]